MYILLLPAEMVRIMADHSQINLDFSSVRMLTMWLLRTSYTCEVTLGVIPASLRRFADDACSRCHSLVLSVALRWR